MRSSLKLTPMFGVFELLLAPARAVMSVKCAFCCCLVFIPCQTLNVKFYLRLCDVVSICNSFSDTPTSTSSLLLSEIPPRSCFVELFTLTLCRYGIILVQQSYNESIFIILYFCTGLIDIFFQVVFIVISSVLDSNLVVFCSTAVVRRM